MSILGTARKHLVLIGGGHAHVLVLRALGMQPEPGLAVTVVAKEISAPYSGMLPGYVAGHYSHDDIHIDLVRLAHWAGARVVNGIVDGIDRPRRRISIAGRAPLAYDLASIGVGITPLLDAIDGASDHGIAVKPVSTFAERWQTLLANALSRDGPRTIAVIGAGAAGFELVLAIRHRLLTLAPAHGVDPTAYRFLLIGSSGVLPAHNAMARRIANREIARQGVRVVVDRVERIAPGRLELASGGDIGCDAVLMATDAGPAPWFEASGLPTDEKGFIAVRSTLQLMDDDDVFAAGDCATVLEHRREKAGVFAVRQGPVLTDNLRRRARGEPARPFVPQSQFLTLLSLGDTRAIAARNGLAISGGWVWRWKDNIDRVFMDRFSDLPRRGPLPDDNSDEMRCAGCAAKVGPLVLSRALDRIGAGTDTRDDAAVIDDGGASLRVESTDFLRAMWPDPYLFGEIAAHHALNDIFAMGATPRHALATAVVPYAAAARMEEDLFQLLAGAKAALSSAGAALVGGHSAEGPELAAGFFVSGDVPRDALRRKAGLRAGDVLILTRPIGTGVIFAAHMRGLARGEAVAAALAEMRRPAGAAAHALLAHGARAITDVSGFGLAGHLLEMLDASAVDAELDLAAVPLYDTAADLARAGIASSLVPENARLAARLDGDAAADPAARALLFDPQTAGGFLAGVPADAAGRCLAALHAAGYRHAAPVGQISAAVGEGARRIVVRGRVCPLPSST